MPKALSSVREANGNIVGTDRDGHEVSITSGGTDSSPALSDDGASILFLRKADKATRGGDVYVVRLPEAPERLLGDDPQRSVEGDKETMLSQFFALAFMPDGRRALLSVNSEGQTETIIAIDLKTRTARPLARSFASQHLIIRKGPQTGNILIIEHASRDSIDTCWLIDGTNGKKLRQVDECGDVRGFDNPRTHKALGF